MMMAPLAWNADLGAVYDLTSNALRPDGWTSADAAGLPIYRCSRPDAGNPHRTARIRDDARRQQRAASSARFEAAEVGGLMAEAA